MSRVLVLGATGMLGNAVLRDFAQSGQYEVFGTARTASAASGLQPELRAKVLLGVDTEQFDSLAQAFGEARPDVVINCIGVVKQLAQAEDPLTAMPINSLLPHRLARLSKVAGARLVHVSTDCVFSGQKGAYLESDYPDADDLYGRSKLLGEVDYPHAITLRTSIIGHELGGGARSLLCWFLAQRGSTKGFTKAIFSGLPTVELSRVIREYVLPRTELHGLYHVSSAAIDKYSLLQHFARAYKKDIEILPSEALVIDRSLDSSRFQRVTGYVPPGWAELVDRMAAFR